MKEFVNPNLHAALVHYPLALLVFGAMIELFSFLWPRSTVRAAGRWMIVLGAFSAIPVATSGIYALRDVATMHTSFETGGGQWKDVLEEAKLTSAQWGTLRYHLLLEAFATAVSVIVVVTWIGASDRWRTRLRWPLLIFLLLSVNLAGAGAYHGGETVYVQGTGVYNESLSKPGQKDLVTNETKIASTGPAPVVKPAFPATSSKKDRIIENINFFTPPPQIHVIMAGIAISFAMMALGLSIRRYTEGLPLPEVDPISAALGAHDTLINAAGDDTIVAGSAIPQIEVLEPTAPPVPAPRFWLLTSLVALVTAMGGYALLALDAEQWSPRQLWQLIVDNMHDGYNRQIAHTITGLAIVILPLILAVISRMAPRGKWALLIVSALLVGAVAAQVWFGITLLYDTSQGPMWHFNS